MHRQDRPRRNLGSWKHASIARKLVVCRVRLYDPGMNRIPKAEAIERLEKAIAQIDSLQGGSEFSPDFSKWRRATKIALARIFGEDSKHHAQFSNVAYSARFISAGSGYNDPTDYFGLGLLSAKTLLESMRDEVREYWTDSPETPAPAAQGKPATNKVFIVHGHDAGMKETVGRFLQCLELEPIILHEQPNAGKTLIEKFEQYSDVSFAVVLLSPDDVGGAKSKELKPRARQNVVLELGFFLGKLGRKYVCPLHKAGVEIPSDYDGVVYVPFDDAGAWRHELFRELKAAGFNIDANKMFKTSGV